MTERDLLSALTSHFELKVQQGMICGNLKNSQDALAFLSKFQGLGDDRESFRSPKMDYDTGEMRVGERRITRTEMNGKEIAVTM